MSKFSFAQVEEYNRNIKKLDEAFKKYGSFSLSFDEVQQIGHVNVKEMYNMHIDYEYAVRLMNKCYINQKYSYVVFTYLLAKIRMCCTLALMCNLPVNTYWMRIPDMNCILIYAM